MPYTRFVSQEDMNKEIGSAFLEHAEKEKLVLTLTKRVREALFDLKIAVERIEDATSTQPAISFGDAFSVSSVFKKTTVEQDLRDLAAAAHRRDELATYLKGMK